ncbi:MAG TPA: RDD family protein [Candidatus Acidoferrales bacterium]|nr:RDD family protein [Candidatus Acidoferrales bacterium]
MLSPDKLTIETPEQTSLEFPLAGIGSRFLALAADTAIQAAAALLLLFVLGELGLRAAPLVRVAPQWTLAAFVVLAFAIYAGYFAFFEAVWNGQTPGKRVAELRVMKDDGRPIGAYGAITRNLIRLVDQLPGIYAVGIVAMLLSRQHKRLGDYVAGTVVVHEKSLQGMKPYPEPGSQAAPPTLDAGRISVEEFQLMDAFLRRRDSLEPHLRRDLAAQILARLAAKLGVAAPGWPESEKLIEALYQRVRTTGLRR